MLSLIVIASGLSLNGCNKTNSGTALPADGDIIRRGNIEDPTTLDPVFAQDIHAFNILLDLYEGLIAEDAHGRPVPGVAESWSVSGDGLVYTFTLRSNAQWSNGNRVVAEDFVRGLRRVAAPSIHSAYASLLESIKNFAAVKSGATGVEALGVLAPDNRTLVINLSEPRPYFLSLLAMPIAFPLYGNGSNPAQFEDPAEFVGNGAYVLAQRSIGSPVRLRRNERYWNVNEVKTEVIEYVAMVDEVAEFNMYRSGELDITGTIPPSHIQIAKSSFASEVRIAPSLALYYLAFDLTEPPLDNPLLRKALSMAIDREKLVDILGRGEQPAYAVVPNGVANYEGIEYSWQNSGKEERLAQAREHYLQAGFSLENPLALKFVYDVGGIHEKVAIAVSSMWQDALGVVVELDKREWKFFLDTRDDRDEWQVMRFSWFGDYNDASTFLDIFGSHSAQNLPRYESADYDQLIQSASLATNQESRTILLAKAEDLLINDYPIAPLYFYVSKHMVKPTVKGFENNVLDRHPSKYLYRQE